VHRRAVGAAVNGIPRATGFLARGAERIYYEVCGSGADLVLCHGAGGNHAVWFQQVAWFAARGRRITSWDQRGFGRSTDFAKEGGPQAAAADLLALLDHLEISHADLVGQSMGGWAALGAALAEPTRVGRLVLADTLGGVAPPELGAQIQRILRGAAALPAQLGLHPALDDSLAERDPALAHLYQMLGAFGEPDLARIAPRLWATQHPPAALRTLDMPALPQLSPADRDRLLAVIVKGGPSRDDRLRGRRHVMWHDSDVHALRHFRAAMGGMLAGLTGDTRIYIAAGAEHQGPPGGGTFAIFARRKGLRP